MSSSQPEEWEIFRRFTDVGSADVMCSWLLREKVLAKVETRSREGGREGEYCVLVHRTLAHRARWVVAQQPPGDEELEFLATGQRPGNAER
jgi:hypothetical protein